MSRVFRCSGYSLVLEDIVRAQGSRLFDSSGKSYLDFEAGVWCAALGHNHPRVNRALADQMNRVAHIGYRYTSDVVESAADRVLATTPFEDGKAVFLSSGSEAVEFAVQAARRLKGRPLLLTLSDSYLAAYGSAGTKSEEDWYSFDWRDCKACSCVDCCDPQCKLLQEVPIDRIGGFVFEPGSSGGLVRFPPPRLVRALASMVEEEDGLIVVDEVTTGLGRTGKWYGFQHYDIAPDFIAMGKGLGNGYPVSAVAMNARVAHALEQSKFHHAQSHQNDPLACAVAAELLTVIRDENLIEHSRELGARLLHGLQDLGVSSGFVREVRGRGLMAALELASEGKHSPLASAYRSLLERGFAVGYKPEAGILRFLPPLTINRDDIDALIGSLGDVLTGLS